jgi:hypothetical protein
VPQQLTSQSIYRVDRAYTFLYNMVFYNMMLRMFLEGYMQESVSTMLSMKDVSTVAF